MAGRSSSLIAMSHVSHERVFWSDDAGDLREHQHVTVILRHPGQSCQLSGENMLTHISAVWLPVISLTVNGRNIEESSRSRTRQLYNN